MELDPLTGLPNRTSFKQKLEAVTAQALPNATATVLCLIDVDDLRQVNDQYGQAVGDHVLRGFAQRLPESHEWYVARIGSNEFGLIAESIEQLEVFARHLSARLNGMTLDVPLHSLTVDITAKAGYVVLTEDGCDLDTLLRRADLALCDAKRTQADRACRFKMAMEENFRRRVVVAKEFREALIDGNIIPHYQPIFRLKTRQVAGLEALARWDHPEKGVLSPTVFMEVFEDHEASIMLTDIMLDRVCRDMREWLDQGIYFGRIGLNITAADLQCPEFAQRVASKLAHYRIRPHHLTLEMTETAVFQSGDSRLRNQMHELREAGVAIALDDFGTGYSSLMHMRCVPFDILKIDKSFVKSMRHSQPDQVIIEALIRLGQDIGYTTVAEGIEVKAEASFLSKMGCTYGQGYFFQKPLPKSNVTTVLAGGSYAADTFESGKAHA